MDYKQTMDYINQTSKSGSTLGLTNIYRLMEVLDNPQEKLNVIHVAGTNGKGSVSAMLESVLIANGYKVGRFSSPAVFQYEEIFSINGESITPEKLAWVFTRIRQAAERVVAGGNSAPTVFELETAAAYSYFEEEDCDIVMMEVGLGGREDATNVIQHPKLSIITSISMDHAAILGPHLEDIARAKAGIMKDGVPVITGWQKPEVMEVLRNEAKEHHAKLIETPEDKISNINMSLMHLECDARKWGTIVIPLTGYAQIENLSLVLNILESLHEAGLDLVKDKCLEGLENTKWPGRFQVIGVKPYVILDGAHNPDAASKLAQTIRAVLKGKAIHFIVGVLADKEYEKVLKSVLPLGVEAYAVTSKSSRALPAEQLKMSAAQYIRQVRSCDSVTQAVNLAYEKADPEDVILAFGSLSFLGEVKEEVEKR